MQGQSSESHTFSDVNHSQVLSADIRLSAAQVIVRLLPFLVVAWTRVSLAIVLPGYIATFDLSISTAGLVVFGIEIGSFATMLVLVFVMDRFGAGHVLQ